jgi:hypothetical protein
MRGIHDIGTSDLSQIIELADHRRIVEVEIKCRFFLEGMQMQGDLGWNRFGLGVLVIPMSSMMESIRACCVNS